jgi:hypothetical protein
LLTSSSDEELPEWLRNLLNNPEAVVRTPTQAQDSRNA